MEIFYNLDSDANLVHYEIFESTKEFIFDGVINSIQSDLFKPFKQLKSIKCNPYYLLKVVRKQGIEWVKNINLDVKVNLSDSMSVQSNIDLLKQIQFQINNFAGFIYDPKSDFFYDEDFCLFVDFPFEQLVVINLYLNAQEKSKMSCTTLWLVQYNSLFEI